MSVEIPKHEIGKVLEVRDTLYLFPVGEGRFTTPIGNGDLAAMVWAPDNCLRLTRNKVNAWDDAPELPVRENLKDRVLPVQSRMENYGKASLTDRAKDTGENFVRNLAYRLR